MLQAIRHKDKWTLAELQQHLQYAVDLEFWTIPLYLAAAYSIKDTSSQAYQLLLAVANQEMLHVQLAANIANAYGCDISFAAPQYSGLTIPHLDFELDVPNPTIDYSPYSAEIGPLDVLRINTFCLIEYPEWGGDSRRRSPKETMYGSIGEFYASVAVGAEQLQRHIQPNRRQISLFSGFYPDFGTATVTKIDKEGFKQVQNLVGAICGQGEGVSASQSGMIPIAYQNQVDDIYPSWSHFWKFKYIRTQSLPETYQGTVSPVTGTAGDLAQKQLIADFATFVDSVEAMFRTGAPTEAFYPQMIALGGSILKCWQNGAVPMFSAPAGAETAAAAVKASAPARRRFPLLNKA